MKIISWNCFGGFRNKFDKITSLDADIYIIQESENPEKYPKFKNKIKNYFWIGEKHKGLLVFSLNENIKLQHTGWEDFYRRFFLPILVNDKFIIIGLWACDPYVHEFYFYLRLIKRYFSYTPIILAGDINSNKVFDHRYKREGSHSDTIALLNSWNYESMYHYFSKEKQGKESIPTFNMHKNKNKPYHIDYCFAKPHNIKHFEILANDEWIELSDHYPILFETTDEFNY